MWCFISISVTFDSTSNALFQMSGKESKDDLDDLVNSIENVSVGQKAKKKKNKKKKDEGGEISVDSEEKVTALENGASENGLEQGAEESAANKKKKSKKKKGAAAVQTDPPTIAVKDLFPSGQFPEGQIMEHPIALSDTTAKNR